MTLFDNFNGGGVENGGGEPVSSTKGKAYCLTSITTYHWNEEKGTPPGTLGLTAKGAGWAGAGAWGRGRPPPPRARTARPTSTGGLTSP